MKYNKIIIITAAVVFFGSCTKLEEKFNSETTQGGSGSGGGGGNAAALLVGAYRSLNSPFQDQARWYAAAEHTTDEAVGPTRGGDWDDNGVWRVYHNHKWTADHGFLTDTYRDLAQAQFAATTVLDNSPTAQQAAEAKFIRAFVMWCVLDGWDQVPFRATSTGDLTKTLPEVKKGTEAADFIINELNAAIPGLPAGNGIGRASKNAARALLMKVYLNKGVYANRATPTFAAGDMNQVITLADQILADFPAYPGGFPANFFDNFAPNNDVIGKELVWTLRNDNASGTGGNGVMYHYHCGTHYNQDPSGWNGFTTLGDFYDSFDPNDRRRGGRTGTTDFGNYPGTTGSGPQFTGVTGMRVGLLFGQQVNGAGANLQDRKGNPLSFTKAVALKESGNNLEVTGIRVVKYVQDRVKQFPADNDMVMFRLADILLMKAEAILRGGTATAGPGGYGATAAAIVNNIRTHPSRGLSALGTVDLNAVYKERGFELYWENWRRNDMIRFGTFLNARQLKGATTSERLLFPIPNQQLTINPNLTQNPGYQ
ncbi:MAG TPA: RagB/SusD family nutrient uptake outer membrane protein [Chitinophagaceae bacterium]|nr:RagB/SusD family nutrient uptake outer membrane protein [Chitinophagaceae bacterium]